GVFPELIEPRRSRNRHDVVALREQPGEHELRHRDPLVACDRRERIEQTEVAFEVFALEARHRQTDVLWRQHGNVSQLASQESATERTERYQRDSQLATGVRS